MWIALWNLQWDAAWSEVQTTASSSSCTFNSRSFHMEAEQQWDSTQESTNDSHFKWQPGNVFFILFWQFLSFITVCGFFPMETLPFKRSDLEKGTRKFVSLLRQSKGLHWLQRAKGTAEPICVLQKRLLCNIVTKWAAALKHRRCYNVNYCRSKERRRCCQMATRSIFCDKFKYFSYSYNLLIYPTMLAKSRLCNDV